MTTDKTDMDIGAQAADNVQAEVNKALDKFDVTVNALAKKVSEQLRATEVKTHFNVYTGNWRYSKGLAAHGIQQGAVKIGIELRGLKPSEKHDVKHDISESLIMALAAKIHIERKNENKSGD